MQLSPRIAPQVTDRAGKGARFDADLGSLCLPISQATGRRT